MGYIYKISNTVNDKVYIGQTTRTVNVRFMEHIYDSRRSGTSHCTKLTNAIRKYGEDAFYAEIVEECPDADLNEREIYWISFYDTLAHGYNLTVGGEGRTFDDDDLIMECWNNGMIIKDIVNLTGHCKLTVKNSLIRSGVDYQEIINRANEARAKSVTPPVYQYDLDGNYIKEFRSIYVASAETGVPLHYIAASLANQTHTGMGFQWRRYKTNNIGACKRMCLTHPRMVYQYTLDGDYIQSFKSLHEAARESGVNHASNIMNACKSNTHIAGNYKWSFEYQNKLPR